MANRRFNKQTTQPLKNGGRAKAMGGGMMNERIGLTAGATGCKLDMKGKGKAYGKNS